MPPQLPIFFVDLFHDTHMSSSSVEPSRFSNPLCYQYSFLSLFKLASLLYLLFLSLGHLSTSKVFFLCFHLINLQSSPSQSLHTRRHVSVTTRFLTPLWKGASEWVVWSAAFRQPTLKRLAIAILGT